MVGFDHVYIAPRVRVALHTLLGQNYNRKFWQLLHKLKSGQFDIPGLRVEKLHTSRGKVYSARLNVDIRVIFSMSADDQSTSLVIWDVDHHDDAYEKVERSVVPALFFDTPETSANLQRVELDGAAIEPRTLNEEEKSDSALVDGLILFRIPEQIFSEPQKFYAFEPNIDRYLRLTPQQQELLGKSDRAFLVQGSAGTGKTTLALFHALNLYESQLPGDVLLFTYQEELACVCRCYAVNLTNASDDESTDQDRPRKRLHVYSYLEFCRHYLRKQIADAPTQWSWVNREMSIRHINEILNSRPRWSRAFNAEDIYGYFYSILKGRFVPGSDQLASSPEEFRRILKGYGSAPDNFEEILEIFAAYEQKLAVFNHKDEADLIRFCYDSLKNRAALSEQTEPAWIVIDELQDFTELEWKSLLLFWENNCIRQANNPGYPFLSGDRNQNISRSGFRWQEVDSYVERILRKIHRPSAFEKIQLHQNFRNTREIFALGEFFRQLSPDSAAADDPPAIRGRKPTLVIGEEKEFTAFLRTLAPDAGEGALTITSPLVILCEDEHYMRRIKEADNTASEGPAFLLSLHAAKGMEFEDVIIYRLFSSPVDIENAATARLFDLWYMAVTRARQSLLVFLTSEDWQRAKELLGDKFEQFRSFFQIVDDSRRALQDFFDQRETYLPNYHVIFLERLRAQEAWNQFQRTGQKRHQEIALRLWEKCRDWRNLGLAYQEIKDFEHAIPYIRQTNLFYALGQCLESVGDFKGAAEAFEADGAPLECARCYALAGQHLQAAQIYEQHHQWLRAAECFAQANESLDAARCFARAQSWQNAAHHFQAGESWSDAAAVLSAAEEFEQAAEMFLRADEKKEAAQSFEQAEQYEQAAELFVDVSAWSDAARCFEKAHCFQQAAEMFLRAGLLSQAARAREYAEDFAAAGETYESAQDWIKAAGAYLNAGDQARAAACFETGGDWQNALTLRLEAGEPRRIANCYERLSNYEQALQYYLQAACDNEAAYCLEKLERFEEAAQKYLQAANLPAAAALLARLGKRLEAARLYLLSAQRDLALEVARGIPAFKNREQIPDLRRQLAEWAESQRRADLAGAVYEDLSEWSKAGDRYRSAMMFGKAAECFERARKFQLAGDLYAQSSRFEEAAECFKRCKQWKKAAEYYELLKRWREAKEMYSLCRDSDGVARCESASEWF